MAETLPLNSLQRSNIVEAIINEIKQLLIAGKLVPGQRLPPEQELAEQLSVGRGSIREAMKMLAALGVVDVRRGDGTYISKDVSSSIIDPLIFAVLVGPHVTADLFEFRRLIDVGYCKLAAEKADAQDFARLDDAIKALEEYWLSGGRDSKVLAQLDLRFHHAILEATKNDLVTRVGHLLITMFSTSVERALRTPEDVQWTQDQHRRVLNALRAGDPAKVEAAVVTGLQRWRERVESNETPAA